MRSPVLALLDHCRAVQAALASGFVLQMDQTASAHQEIKKFLGPSENAVKTQIWCAVSTYVLIAIVKKELQLDASLYTLLQILSASVFEKAQLTCAVQPSANGNISPPPDNQLMLFNF